MFLFCIYKETTCLTQSKTLWKHVSGSLFAISNSFTITCTTTVRDDSCLHVVSKQKHIQFAMIVWFSKIRWDLGNCKAISAGGLPSTFRSGRWSGNEKFMYKEISKQPFCSKNFFSWQKYMICRFSVFWRSFMMQSCKLKVILDSCQCTKKVFVVLTKRGKVSLHLKTIIKIK